MKAKTREFSFKLFSVMFIHPPGNASFCARLIAATRDVSGTYANPIRDLIQITSACRNDNIRPEVILSKDLLHFLCKRIAYDSDIRSHHRELSLALQNSKISGAKRAGGAICRR